MAHEITAKCERQMQASGRYYPDDVAPRAWHVLIGLACLLGLLRESYMCGFSHPFGGGGLFLTYLLDAMLIADIYVEMGLAVEASNGSVTFQNRRIGPAPSIRAASCNSGGMPPSAARKMMIGCPRLQVITTAARLGNAVSGQEWGF